MQILLISYIRNNYRVLRVYLLVLRQSINNIKGVTQKDLDKSESHS